MATMDGKQKNVLKLETFRVKPLDKYKFGL